MIKDYSFWSFRRDIREGPVLLFFYSKGCGPCKVMGFVLEDIDEDYGDDVLIIRIPFDNTCYAKRYGVEGYPTLIMLKDGKEVERKIGLRPKEQVEKIIVKAL